MLGEYHSNNLIKAKSCNNESVIPSIGTQANTIFILVMFFDKNSNPIPESDIKKEILEIVAKK
jgi:hypothetical protein